MPFRVRMQLQGFAEFVDELKQFSQAKARAIVRRGVQAGSTPILRAAKKLTPIDSGQLKRSMGKRIKTYRSTGATIAIIGPREGFKAEVVDKRGQRVLRNPTKYIHLVELGHRIAIGGTLERKKSVLGKPQAKNPGHSGGFVEGRHFLQRALEQTKYEAQAAMISNIKGAIQREWARIAAKAAAKVSG